MIIRGRNKERGKMKEERLFVKRGTIRRKRLFVKREKKIERKGSID